MRVVKVRQRQWAIGFRGKDAAVLQTHNIWTCTGFFGVSDEGVAFLAHFDGPFLKTMLPDLIAELRPHVKDFRSFDIRIMTCHPGRLMGWPTRERLRQELNKLNLFRSIPKTQHLARTFFWKGGVRVDANTGHMTGYKYLVRPEYDRYKPAATGRTTLVEDETTAELKITNGKHAKKL